MVVVLLLGGMGSWAVATKLAGAVIAPGTLVVENNVKKVQHPTGGVVKELRVKEGDKVAAGDLVVLLDGTQARANLEIIVGGLDELTARKARWRRRARERRTSPSRPHSFRARMNRTCAKSCQASKTCLPCAKRSGWVKNGSWVSVSPNWAKRSRALPGQAAAKEREIGFVAKELAGTQQLYQQGLMTLARLTDVERSAARLDGERAQLIASIAEAKGRIAETELEIIQIDQKLRSEVGTQLADLRTKLAELEERRTAAQDLLDRLAIRAPQSGTIHDLAVHTIGGVVQAAEPLMLIIPSSTALAVDARIAPGEVDRIRVGQKVSLRFSNFQPADDTSDRWPARARFGRRAGRREDRSELLHGPDRHSRPTSSTDWAWSSFCPACRSKHSSRRKSARCSPTC